MPSGAGNPNKNPPGGRRPSRPNPKNVVNLETISQDPAVQSSTPERTERRRRPNKRPQQSGPATLETQPQTASLTSPPSLTQGLDSTLDGTSEPTVLPTDNTKTASTPSKPQYNTRAMSSTTIPRNNRSPRSEQRNMSMTPVKSNNTPIQAYAGPTFHASPAPSALPIPKFFSKSMSATEKGTSLKAMMQDESSESSSSKSDDSPTMKSSLQVNERPGREASPLDVFFNADREEKAKRSASELNSVAERSPSQVRDNFKSVSPIPEYMRHHSRQSTGGSIGGMFPLEMDASEKSSSAHNLKASPHFSAAQRADSFPSILTAQTLNSEEQARAKTEALKRFLLSPQPQRPASASAGRANVLPFPDSPASGPFANDYARSNSASSTPHSSSLNASSSAGAQLNNTFGYPYLQQSPTAILKRSSQSRPLSSHLRREMTNSDLAHNTNNDAPSTPTPIRSYNVNTTSPAQNAQQNHHVLPPPQQQPSGKRFKPEDALRVVAGQGNNAAVDIMENELRRILKLDVIGGGGATGVRS